jgi:hypothetical protein
MIDWIIAGIVATYAHKKWPRATEKVAGGIARAGAWTLRKAAEHIDGGQQRKQPNSCCVEFQRRYADGHRCITCGTLLLRPESAEAIRPQPASMPATKLLNGNYGCKCCESYFDNHPWDVICPFCRSPRPI